MTPRDLQTLRNMGNEAEEAADEIDRLRAELERLRAQEPYGQITTHTVTGQQFFYRWPDPPYLDNAKECISVYTAPPAQPAPDPELTQLENDLIESVGQMMRGESVELPVQQWISADHPPTNTQEYVHDLLVRNRYGNVAIVSYDGYAKYFEAESANRLGGHEVVEWRHLPSDFAQPAQRLTDGQIADCVAQIKPYSLDLVMVPAEELVAFVRAIEAALIPQGWQPIETAPKDGTHYLACDGKKMWTRNQPPNCYAGDWECNQNRTLWRGHADGLNPTHWMPLPKSPEAI